eukprot:767579-Hanusia_phi.AAC.15
MPPRSANARTASDACSAAPEAESQKQRQEQEDEGPSGRALSSILKLGLPSSFRPSAIPLLSA